MLNANIPAVPVQTPPNAGFYLCDWPELFVCSAQGTRHTCVCVCVFGAHGNLGEVAQGFKEQPLLGG